MPRYKPSAKDLEALICATEQLLRAAGLPHGALQQATLPKRGGVSGVEKSLAALLDARAETDAVCVEDVVAQFGSHRATIQTALGFLAHLTILRDAFVPSRHQRGHFFALRLPAAWSGAKRAEVLAALESLLATRVAKEHPELRRLLLQAHAVARGDLGPDQLQEGGTLLSSAYFRWLEREAPRWIDESQPWAPTAWGSPCGLIMTEGRCVLPRGHDCGHHDDLLNIHYVTIGDDEIELPAFMARIHIHTVGDAQAFLRAHARGRHMALARRSGADRKEIRTARQLVELALMQAALPEGPVSPLMARNLARLGIAEA